MTTTIPSRFTQWKPDRTIAANAERYKDVPDVPRVGGIITHKKADGSLCEGSIWFDSPRVRETFPGHHYWAGRILGTVDAEPLIPVSLRRSWFYQSREMGASISMGYRIWIVELMYGRLFQVTTENPDRAEAEKYLVASGHSVDSIQRMELLPDEYPSGVREVFKGH